MKFVRLERLVGLSLVACSTAISDHPDSALADSSTDAVAAVDAGADVDTSPLAAEIKKDLLFRTVGKIDLAGDLYLPARTTPVAAVIVIHGGGFSSGDKGGDSEVAWGEILKTAGIAAFVVNYRVYSDFSGGEVAFPAAVMDIKCSISWLRMKAATYRIDANHIFAFGSSAGGFYSNFLGTTGDDPTFTPNDCAEGAKESNRVQGVVTYFGPSDWNALFNDPARAGSANAEKKLIGLGSSTTPCAPNSADANGICKSASATTYAGATDPPFFLTHSVDDPTVPVGQSRTMKAALDAAKVAVTYREVDGLKHGWHANPKDETALSVRADVLAWLSAHK